MVKRKESMSVEDRLAAALVPEEEWPYEIPENWLWTKIGSLTDVIGGGTPSTSVPEYYNEGTIPWLSPADLSDYEDIYISQGAKNITTLGLEKSSARLLPMGTVCLSSRAPIGYVVITQNPLSTNQGFKSFPPSPSFLPEYLYWYLKGNKPLLESRASGTTFLELSGRKAAEIELPLPPLPEQHRIVSQIESLFAKLDETAEEAQAVIDGYEDRKAAILHRAFTGELTEEWRVLNNYRYDQWTSRKLSECGSWIGGGTPSMSNPEYWEKGDLLWITSKDMKTNLIEDTLMHTNMLGVSNSSANYCDKPSLLFVMRSGILRRTLPISMVKKPFTVNQDIKALSPNDIDLDYLYYVCKAHEKAMLVTCMKNGTTVESINSQMLMSFTVPIASKPEQHEIVRRLDTLLAAEAATKAAAEATLTNITTLRQTILARAFRGELGTNDPNDEPAIELIKRTISTQ